MPRIRKEDHPRILAMVDEEKQKVSDVALLFGCTPANIYALLNKLRRGAGELPLAGPVADSPVAADDIPEPVQPPEPVMEALAALAEAQPVPAPEPQLQPQPEIAPVAPAPVAKAAPAANVVAFASDEKKTEEKKAVGARLAKPGFGLMMRTPDGDENTTPYRSLEDLLSAIKPILRGTARSSEPVWFAISPIDLGAFDADAA